MYQRLYYLILLYLLCYVFACKEDSVSSDNEKPGVSIVYPANNSIFPENTLITINVDASDNESVQDVQFYIDSGLEFTDNAKPYSYDWDTNGKAGNHTIKARAFDENINMGESEVVSIMINANTAPTASFTITPSNGNTSVTFQFDASDCSDNEDQTSVLEIRWDWENDGNWDTQYSTNKTATHQYSDIGIYTVKMNVIDTGELVDSKTIQIPVLFECGTVTDIDGNIYVTTKIGNQWWMAENLKVTHYRNGDAIPNVTDSTQWINLTTGAYCNYNNDINKVATYGRLYNWYAVDTNFNIAPAGWHVPTDEEWKELEMYLGMSQAQANAPGYRGIDEGGKMKETGTVHWNSPNTGANNSSGFTALPGGNRDYYDCSFYSVGRMGSWWSSTNESGSYALCRSLDWSHSQVHRGVYNKHFGFSVRCVRD